MPPSAPTYPWYEVVTGRELEQGDILEACPVFAPPDELAQTTVEADATVPFNRHHADVIVMSQSCDLVEGREKLEQVLLCTLWLQSEFTDGPFARVDAWENARKGRLPAFHVLAACDLPENEQEVRVADFRRIYTLPVSFVRKRVAAAPRIRLLPPYREHLSQAFARFFMRVGLPVDIPSFARPKH